MKIFMVFVFLLMSHLESIAQNKNEKDSVVVTKVARLGKLASKKVSMMYFNVYNKDTAQGKNKLAYRLYLGKKYSVFFWDKEQHMLYFRRGIHKIIIKAGGFLPKKIKLKTEIGYDYTIDVYVVGMPPID